MIFILKTLIFLKAIHQVLFTLYLWQLKEYRPDRFTEHIARTKKGLLSAWLHLSLAAPISLYKLPRITVKSTLLFFINTVLYIPFFTQADLVLPLLALVITPFIVATSLTPLWLPELLLRQIIYTAAKKKIARYKIDHGLITIGVTGSVGKSTTKSFIAQVLSSRFKLLETPKSVNTPLGVSLTALKKLTPEHTFFIVEMGAYKTGEIRELCNIVKPQIGVLTGISNQHRALFGSQENIIRAKSELLQTLPQDGVAIINKQSKHTPTFDQSKIKKVIYYTTGAHYTLTKKGNIPDFLKINIEPAITIARLYKIHWRKIATSVRKLVMPDQTMVECRGFGGSTIIDDSFSANFEGVLGALDYLAALSAKKRIVVTSCLIELGDQTARIHQALGRKLSKNADLVIFTTNECAKDIKKGASGRDTIRFAANTKETIKTLKQHIVKDSVVLIEGRVDRKIIEFLKGKNV